jgi:transposase
VTRPIIRFVSQQSVGVQDLHCLRRVRSRLVACLRQLINQILGSLAEYAIETRAEMTSLDSVAFVLRIDTVLWP